MRSIILSCLFIATMENARDVRNDVKITVDVHRTFDHCAHDAHDRGTGRAIGSPRQRKQKARGAAPPQVIPQPARRAIRNLLLGLVVPGFDRFANQRPPLRTVTRVHRQTTRQRNRSVRGRLRRAVLKRAHPPPHRADVVEVDRRRDNFHVAKRKLSPLGHQPPVHHHCRASVEVQPISIATLLIRVQVHAARLRGGAADEFKPLMQLAQFMMRAAAVGKHLYAAQS